MAGAVQVCRQKLAELSFLRSLPFRTFAITSIFPDPTLTTMSSNNKDNHFIQFHLLDAIAVPPSSPPLASPSCRHVRIHMGQMRTARDHRSNASLGEEGGVALVPRPVGDGQTAQHVSTDALGESFQPFVCALGVGVGYSRH